MHPAFLRWLMTADPGADIPETIGELYRRPSWHQDAACRGQGVRSWFSEAPANLDRARTVCAGCPVRDECYQFAMSDPDLEGVWAGFTAKERREIRRARVA